MAKICRVCGAQLDDDSSFCAVCGAKAPETPPQPQCSFCANCGAKLGAGAMFCGNCGAPTEAAPAAKAPKIPRKTKRPINKKNIALVLINVLLVGVCIALIIVGIKTIPDSIREAGLPYVPVEENETDAEIQDEYDTVRSGGSLFEIADEDGDERSHVYYPVFDGEGDADQ